MTPDRISSFSIGILLFVIFMMRPPMEWKEAPDATLKAGNPPATAKSVSGIALPAGYRRLPQTAGSFGAWLRTMPLKQDSRVYLYNGQLKGNQQAQYAVLDISVGNKDLQQCADAVMRLYAEYLYAENLFGKISFNATDGTKMNYGDWMKGDRFVLKNNRLQKVR